MTVSASSLLIQLLMDKSKWAASYKVYLRVDGYDTEVRLSKDAYPPNKLGNSCRLVMANNYSSRTQIVEQVKHPLHECQLSMGKPELLSHFIGINTKFIKDCLLINHCV